MTESYIPKLTDSLTYYVNQINQFPLLTREEEKELAIRYKKYNDIEAAHKLITSNLRFVVKIAHEYKAYGMKLVDLIQEGNIGLMMALKHFNPEKGYRFISYAVWWIRAYIQNFIMKSWSLVKIGTTQVQKKLFYKLNKTKEEFIAENKDFDFAEIAEELGVKEEEVQEMEQRMSFRDFSLNNELEEDQNVSYLDLLEDPTKNQEELVGNIEEQQYLRKRINDALSKLNEKERFIIENRVMAEEPMTLREIGLKFNISRERVRQIEKEALKKLKMKLAA
ncbi:MAG: RNA polymerase sigma factor RpoH [Deltaproteobacteria bacterium]|nr:RNA polymerase sigma factor RpoH [Deltaproteobacteria bacterium]RLA90924.1 MAG: RNA polymerase sigma factor RpoH [Deltaproteobacteria bacterium]